MSAESIVFDTLRLDPVVAGLVGERIFPDVAPQEFAWPIIVYARSSTATVTTIHGPIVLEDVVINMTCWAETRPAAEALGNAAKQAMISAGHQYLDRRGGWDAETNGYASALDFLISEL